MRSHKGEKERTYKTENEREREKKRKRTREEKKKRKRKREMYMLLMYTHPLFKNRRRLSPPQASLGNAECALFKGRKK
jgi:hypothetical protein